MSEDTLVRFCMENLSSKAMPYYLLGKTAGIDLCLTVPSEGGQMLYSLAIRDANGEISTVYMNQKTFFDLKDAFDMAETVMHKKVQEANN